MVQSDMQHVRVAELERAIVRAVAALDGYRDEYGVHCAFPQCRLQDGYGYAFSDDVADVPHAPDCPVTRARALLRLKQSA
jgi:hypothetical protein